MNSLLPSFLLWLSLSPVHALCRSSSVMTTTTSFRKRQLFSLLTRSPFWILFLGLNKQMKRRRDFLLKTVWRNKKMGWMSRNREEKTRRTDNWKETRDSKPDEKEGGWKRRRDEKSSSCSKTRMLLTKDVREETRRGWHWRRREEKEGRDFFWCNTSWKILPSSPSMIHPLKTIFLFFTNQS